jgi:CubicO group peptidase (beta-lactamase class C family)
MPIDRRAVLAGMMAAAASPALAARATPLERCLAARMASKQIPGAGLAVVREGRTLACDGHGSSDIELDRPATATTVFPMASASKLLAGLTAMQLVEARRLDLDASISLYLPEMVPAHSEVRVAQLLNLTSGLNGPRIDPAFGAEAQRREQNQQYADTRKLEYFTPAEIIAAAAPLPAHAPPGAVWRYDQFPFFLFGQIVSRVSGQPYEAVVADRLFTRLGMRTAAFGDSRSLVRQRRSSNYSRETGVLQNLALRYTPSYWPAAGCNASATDLVRLWNGLRPGRLLQRESLQRMFAPTVLTSGESVDYGLGCTISRAAGRTWIGHEGGGCCYLGWWPMEELGIGVLFNLSGSKEDGIEGRLAELILDRGRGC